MLQSVSPDFTTCVVVEVSLGAVALTACLLAGGWALAARGVAALCACSTVGRHTKSRTSVASSAIATRASRRAGADRRISDWCACSAARIGEPLEENERYTASGAVCWDASILCRMCSPIGRRPPRTLVTYAASLKRPGPLRDGVVGMHNELSTSSDLGS